MQKFVIVILSILLTLMVLSCHKTTKLSAEEIKPTILSQKQDTQQQVNYSQTKLENKVYLNNEALAKPNDQQIVNFTNGSKPGLNVNVNCPAIAFSAKRVQTTITIENTGDMKLSDVNIRASFTTHYGKPDSIRFISAEGSSFVSDRVATWNIGSLNVREKKKYSVVIFCGGCKHCLKVVVDTAEGIHKQAECCTEWMGCLIKYSLLLECSDTIDSLAVDEETTYAIKVTHHGTLPHHNVKIEVVFPKEISPVSGSGKCIINGQRVTVTPYPILLPGKQIQWYIKAKAISPGDARVKVYLTSGSLEKFRFPPMTEEESTEVKPKQEN
ncbi:hypothetical protein [Candidatus Uabimicrobium sp. HlEnr_7]|uniref:hypothetical protein n=1 Tax=Candidatus Uabimicrobium helgolandensis TaxID=3095367 RepID=UPI0035566EA3